MLNFSGSTSGTAYKNVPSLIQGGVWFHFYMGYSGIHPFPCRLQTHLPLLCGEIHLWSKWMTKHSLGIFALCCTAAPQSFPLQWAGWVSLYLQPGFHSLKLCLQWLQSFSHLDKSHELRSPPASQVLLDSTLSIPIDQHESPPTMMT
jgi:hypothetical protein